ncbi:MAG TPA: hypothetical protein IAB23_11725 [Candidatus Scybalocola faecavium]|nr:hypothetical protein [Candidatus Scybalocola faecavium]
MEKRAYVILRIFDKREEKDLDIPLNISAKQLVLALNTAYELGIDVSDGRNIFLKAENPIVLLKGNKTLEELGVRDGTVINVI